MKLVVDKASLVSVADAIRTKGNTTNDLEFPNGFVDGINAIESGGGGTEEDIWYETSKNWTNQFASIFLNSTSIKSLPKLNFEQATDMRSFATNSTLQSIDYYINTVNATDFRQAFYNCQNLKTIVGINTSNATNVFELFKKCPLLEVIQEPLDISKNAIDCSGMFIGCAELKEIRFIAGCIIKQAPNFVNCPKLSAESIQSIVDGLAYVTTSQNLKFHRDIVLTDNHKQVINAKGWTLIQ